jgi:hypothetical protein
MFEARQLAGDLRLLELLDQAIAVHEVQGVRRALPVFDDVVALDELGDLVELAELQQIGRSKARCDRVGRFKVEHAVAIGRRRQPLGSAHDAAQVARDGIARGLHRIDVSVVGREVAQPDAVVGKCVADVIDRRRVVAQEEGRGLEKVALVILIELRRPREHAVRRRREQQRLRVLLTEEQVGELADGLLWVEQAREALELVQDDEIGLQGSDARLCQLTAEPANDADAELVV